MVDTDTFLTTLYVMVDDLCKSELSLEKEPGPEAALGKSEALILSIFSQWSRFRNHMWAFWPLLSWTWIACGSTSSRLSRVPANLWRSGVSVAFSCFSVSLAHNDTAARK